MTVDWPEHASQQVAFHWDHHVRPRLEGLTDDEYFWEPVPHSWSIRPRGQAVTSMAAGRGDWVADFEFPEPVPAPVTTIAWRLGHVLVGVLGMRNASHFSGPPVDYQSVTWPPDALTARRQLDAAYATWSAGVASLDVGRWGSPVGPAEGPFADRPYAELVLHINREVIHHMAEVLLLRDLYRHRTGDNAN